LIIDLKGGLDSHSEFKLMEGFEIAGCL